MKGYRRHRNHPNAIGGIVMLEIMHRNTHPMNAYNPFRDMEEMERRFFNDPFFSTPDLATFKTDITDEGDHFLLEA